LKRENGTPTLESLKRITGKIYALLSDDWYVEVISMNKLLLLHESLWLVLR
jgi:hypothetical protein